VRSAAAISDGAFLRATPGFRSVGSTVGSALISRAKVRGRPRSVPSSGTDDDDDDDGSGSSSRRDDDDDEDDDDTPTKSAGSDDMTEREMACRSRWFNQSMKYRGCLVFFFFFKRNGVLYQSVRTDRRFGEYPNSLNMMNGFYRASVSPLWIGSFAFEGTVRCTNEQMPQQGLFFAWYLSRGDIFFVYHGNTTLTINH